MDVFRLSFCPLPHGHLTLIYLPRYNWERQLKQAMVMPLVDEDRPKCYLCHKMFANTDALRAHHKSEHAEVDAHKSREPAPGDVTVF